MLEAIEEIKPILKEKLLPHRNPDISWFYCFFPALIAYFYILTSYINEKPQIGIIQTIDNNLIFPKLIPQNTKVEIITSGLSWAEGPIWVEDESCSCNYLLFSDTKKNQIFRWEDGKGLFTVGKTLYMENTGCRRSQKEACNTKIEPGSNGLIRFPVYPKAAPAVDLIACQHGNRAISIIFENGTKLEIATHYGKNRLNSPNDVIWSPEGNLYFTDPPYGLYNHENKMVNRELNHSGVYMIKKIDILTSLYTGLPTKNVRLLDKSLSRANGLAFSPDYAKLYVSNSDKKLPIWKVFDVSDDGLLTNGKIFFDGRSLTNSSSTDTLADSASYANAPDGFKIDLDGNLFASGPGGLLVISAAGKLIGRILVDKTITNVAFGGEGKIYLTASDSVLRFASRARSAAVSTPSKLFV